MAHLWSVDFEIQAEAMGKAAGWVWGWLEIR